MSYRMITGLVILALVVVVLASVRPNLRNSAQISEIYDTPLPPPNGTLQVYHLGHSLVGRDMPAMLAQLAGGDHDYALQLGWGTSLREHWETNLQINGFEMENDTPKYRDAHDAIGSGDYDAVILTEMVEIKDAIRYHKSDKYLAKWAGLAPNNTRLYLYESWHKLDDPDGWLNRLDNDLSVHWEDRILIPAITRAGGQNPIYVIPAGQVMAQFVREIDAIGGLGNVGAREDLFARLDDGTLDTIHLNDLGAYLVALTHYAVVYHRSPVGLPYELKRADGVTADAPSADVARLMQETVWKVVSGYPKTGIAP